MNISIWEPLTLYLSKNLMMSLVNLVLLPLFPFHLGLKPVIIPDFASSKSEICLFALLESLRIPPLHSRCLGLFLSHLHRCYHLAPCFPPPRHPGWAARTSFQSPVLILSFVCSETLNDSPLLTSSIRVCLSLHCLTHQHPRNDLGQNKSSTTSRTPLQVF